MSKNRRAQGNRSKCLRWSIKMEGIRPECSGFKSKKEKKKEKTQVRHINKRFASAVSDFESPFLSHWHSKAHNALAFYIGPR